MCAHMFATFEETPDPAKFKMKYWGAASYLQTGSKHDLKGRKHKSPKFIQELKQSAEILIGSRACIYGCSKLHYSLKEPEALKKPDNQGSIGSFVVNLSLCFF